MNVIDVGVAEMTGRDLLPVVAMSTLVLGIQSMSIKSQSVLSMKISKFDEHSAWTGVVSQ